MTAFKRSLLVGVGLVGAALPAMASDRLDKAAALLKEAAQLLEEEKAARVSASGAPSAPVAAAAMPAAAAAVPTGEAAAPVAVATKESYDPGVLVLVRPAPDKVAAVPADEAGRFIYAGGDLAAHDVGRHKVRYRGVASFEFQGFIQAKEKGRYQWGAEGKIGGMNWTTKCTLLAWVEDRPLTNETREVMASQGHDVFSMVGGADLEPGLYKFRMWTGCPAKIMGSPTLTITPLFKGPSDMSLGPIQPTQIVHRAK